LHLQRPRIPINRPIPGGPVSAAGPTDTLSRILAAKLGDVWKARHRHREQKGGAAGRDRHRLRGQGAPDGYTIQLGTQSTNGSNKIFYPNLPYDPITDFEALTLLGTACMALVIPPAFRPARRRNSSTGSRSRTASPMRRPPARASTSPPSCWSSAPASRRRSCPIAAARRRSPT
jgi:hypothetical protein